MSCKSFVIFVFSLALRVMYIVLCFSLLFLPYFVVAEIKPPLVLEKGAPTIHHKEEEVSMLENDEKIVKENGERRSNGIGAGYRSDRSEERQPDVMDDHPGKSRSTFLSCHTSVTSYAYHFFQIWYFIES